MKRKIRIKLRKAKRIDNHAHLSIRSESNAKIEYLQESMKKNRIDFSIVLAAYFPRKTGSISNEQILSLTNGYENILVFGSLDIENEFEKEYMRCDNFKPLFILTSLHHNRNSALSLFYFHIILSLFRALQSQ